MEAIEEHGVKQVRNREANQVTNIEDYHVKNSAVRQERKADMEH